MIRLRKSQDRGHFVSDWLDSYHTFSFATYHDPEHMGFRSLRVINEDRVAPEGGFPLHPHKEMEILSFVLEGTLKHKDSLGHEELIHAGEVQRISAGTGIMHSEYNPSGTDSVHFLQIWILPDEQGLTPAYESKVFEPKEPNSLQLLASKDGRDGSVVVHQDVSLYSGELDIDHALEYRLDTGRHAWLQITAGELEVAGQLTSAGDGVAISDETVIGLVAPERARFLLFDLG